MTPVELIEKYRITSRGDGTIMIPQGKKLSAAEVAEIRTAKPEILAEFERREQAVAQQAEAAKANLADEKTRIVAGQQPITATFQDGEYLSGYAVRGQAAQELMEEIGLAPCTSGWGYHLDFQAVKVLGETFTYARAVEYLRPRREAEAARQAAKDAARETKFAQARETGKPVILRQWSEECNNCREECDIDDIVLYVMPDGTTKEARSHTW